MTRVPEVPVLLDGSLSPLLHLLHCTIGHRFKSCQVTKGTSSWAGLNWDGTRHRELSSNKILWVLRCGLVMSGTGRVYEFMVKLPRFNYVYLHILHILQLCSSPAGSPSYPKAEEKLWKKRWDVSMTISSISTWGWSFSQWPWKSMMSTANSTDPGLQFPCTHLTTLKKIAMICHALHNW